jgi:hypothetical protein
VSAAGRRGGPLAAAWLAVFGVSAVVGQTLDDVPRAPQAAAGEARLRLDQDRYRSLLSPRDLEQSRALQEQFHREWLAGRPEPQPQWLTRPAPAVGPPVPPAAPRVPTLPQRFEQEAWDLQRLQQRQEAEASRLRQRDATVGLPPGATLRQRQQFQSDRAAEQLHFDMLRPTR